MEKDVYHNIILKEDIEKLLALNNDEKEEFLLVLIYNYLPWKSLGEMNEVQKTIYLASKLEDICQIDALPSLSKEKEFFLVLPEIKAAYENLGAFKSAALLDEFIALIPPGIVPEWDWLRQVHILRVHEEFTQELQPHVLPPYVARVSRPLLTILPPSSLRLQL